MNGLKKVFELNSGVSGEYWVPTSAHIDFTSGKIEIRIALYYNKSAYDAGKPPMPQAQNMVLDLPEVMEDEVNKLLPKIVALEEARSLGLPGGMVPGFFVDAVIDKAPPTPAP